MARLVGMNPEVNIEAGLHIYDDFPLHDEYYYKFTDEATVETSWGRRYDYNSPLPMYVSGNVYFNGAKPYAKETLNHVDTENKITLELIEEDGKYTLKTNLYDYLPKMKTEFVDTEMLGKAFMPEQAFENPDGSPLRIDEDFLGERRGPHPTPGPFESAGKTFRLL